MIKIVFTMQDAPDFSIGMDAELNAESGKEYSVKEEQALALLIYSRFPKLKECHRRIKKLTVVDEIGNTYETDDFDIYGSLIKEKEER